MVTTPAVEQKELIRYRVEEGVAILEMDDPPANTYTYEMMRQLDTAILQGRMDESVHVIVLRGAGEKFFSAGASIPMLTKADPDRKSTRLNSSHGYISYAVFCLKKKKIAEYRTN